MTEASQILPAHHLKVLRLPTFVQKYEKLACQYAAEGVEHMRYLIRLAELELIDRERHMVARRENVIALGNSGTDKPHFALGLGLAACQKGLAVGAQSPPTLLRSA